MRLFDGITRFFARRGNVFSGVDVLVVGLGNPGEKYTGTRHNVGFMVADAFAAEAGGGQWFAANGADVTVRTLPSGKRVAIARPRTFMNRSGEAVGALISRAGLTSEQCIVAVDDIHLRTGTIRVRRNGSDGGHNGLKSVIAAIGAEFIRVRIGVGPVARNGSMIDFVLGRFEETELPVVREAVLRASKAVETIIAEGVGTAMNTYNRQ